MTKKILWRLKTLPTTEELQSLVKDGLLSKDEARQILFSQEDEKERDAKSLEMEVKFLRELVTQLSGSRTNIVETIKKVYVPYKRYDWYQPYEIFCGAGPATGYVTSLTDSSSSGAGPDTGYAATLTGTSGTGIAGRIVGALSASNIVQDFRDIKTF